MNRHRNLIERTVSLLARYSAKHEVNAASTSLPTSGSSGRSALSTRIKLFSAFAATSAGIVCFSPATYALAETSIAPPSASEDAGNWVSLDAVTEQWTGTTFPVTLQDSHTEEPPYALLGASVRCMLGMCNWKPARGYAFGLYVRPTPGLKTAVNMATKNAAAGSEGATETSSAIHPDALTALSEYPVDKCIRLVFVRDIAGPHVSKGFSRSLYGRIRERNGGAKQSRGKEALRALTAVFRDKGTMKTGTEVRLVISGADDSVTVEIDGQVQRVIPGDRSLVLSLLDLYLGPNAVSEEGRTAVCDGLAKLVA